jgi:hypothetical protein
LDFGAFSSSLSATPTVQRKYVGNGWKKYFGQCSVAGQKPTKLFLDLMKGKFIIISGLRYEHRFDLQINLHYTVEPWHENTCTYSEKK